ncbi:MAG: tRNA pseudouridine synthase A, partial [Bacilli bacterium]
PKKIEDVEKFRYALNRLIDQDINISLIKAVSDDFHARLSAKRKTYLYIINTGERDPFKKDFEYHYPRKLDVAAMKEAADLFVGRHDFRNFTSKEEDEDDFVRDIFSIRVTNPPDHIFIEMIGSGFMRYMVRMIVGTLIEIGMGRFTLAETKELLDNKNRHFVNFKAPPHGLYLVEVAY